MNKYYRMIKQDFQEEKKFYSEELGKSDWKHLKEAGEMFLTHAYSHLFHISQSTNNFAKLYGFDASQVKVFGDDEYNKRYSQFYLNLAVGLEILLKSILLRKDVKINQKLKGDPNNSLDPEKTIPFGVIIGRHLKKVFPKLSKSTLEEIKATLKLINLRRNNIAHCSKRSHDTYAHEHRFSYITLYIYEKYFYGENSELTELLLKSLGRSKVTQQSIDFNPLKIKPRSLRVRAV